MSTLFDFLGIVMLVFGVLQIILFFKMWRMTDNVGCIKKKLNSQSIDEVGVVRLYLLGDLDGLRIALFNNLYDELMKEYKESAGFKSVEAFEENIESIKDYHKQLFAKYGIPFPEKVEALKTFDDFSNL